MSKFFGLRVGKPTTQPLVLDEDVQLTRATLVWKAAADENKIASLMIRRGGTTYILCNLFPKPAFCQVPLDIRLEKDEQFVLSCSNNTIFSVHVTGYTIPSLEAGDAEEIALPSEIEQDKEAALPAPTPPPPSSSSTPPLTPESPEQSPGPTPSVPVIDDKK